MEWKQDAEVMDALAQYCINQKDDLGKLLNALHDHNDGSPAFAFLQIYGTFVYRFCDLIKEHTEIDAIELATAEIANHPTVQNMVASMVGKQINRRLDLE